MTALEIACLVGDSRSNRIRFRFLPDQIYAQPVVLLPGYVAQQNRRSAIDMDQHVNRAIIVEVSNGQAARRNWSGKNGAALRADVLEPPPGVVHENRRLPI